MNGDAARTRAGWVAVLAGPSGYAALLVGGFWLVPAMCAVGSTWPLHALSAGALGTAVLSLAAATWLWRHHRRAPEPTPRPAPPPLDPARPGRERLMAVAGLLLGGLSVLLVVFHWAPAFVVDPCR